MTNIRKAYDVAKNDREDLEGKEVIYYIDEYNKSICLVVGCNRSVGITVVSRNDIKHKRICFRGPVVGNPTSFDDKKCTWNEMYDTIVGMIEDGKITPRDLLILRDGKDSDPGECTSPCAYSQ